jgi:hypothetical protein
MTWSRHKVFGAVSHPITEPGRDRGWGNSLTSRNACGAQPDCLVDAYTSRMMLLKTIKDDLGL